MWFKSEMLGLKVSGRDLTAEDGAVGADSEMKREVAHQN